MVAQLETVDDAGLLAFYEKVRPARLRSLTSDPAKLFYTWPNGQLGTLGGDPIDWIRAHGLTRESASRSRKRSNETARRTSTGSRPTRSSVRESRHDWDLAHRGHQERLALVARRQGAPGTSEPPTDDPRAHFAAAPINPNISRIHRALKVQPDGTEQSVFSFAAQIEVVYWHLANVAENGTVARCKRPGCGAFFIQRHRSQEDRAPRWGQRESPCALWVRQRRLGSADALQRIATDSKTEGAKAPKVRKSTTKETRQSTQRAKRA